MKRRLTGALRRSVLMVATVGRSRAAEVVWSSYAPVVRIEVVWRAGRFWPHNDAQRRRLLRISE
jgi:hypothetical protein